MRRDVEMRVGPEHLHARLECRFGRCGFADDVDEIAGPRGACPFFVADGSVQFDSIVRGVEALILQRFRDVLRVQTRCDNDDD